jgi:8-oxo-dGTP pyrophosphatase MutT (NUDIX family)
MRRAAAMAGLAASGAYCMAACDSGGGLFSSRVVSHKDVASTRWLKLQTITYTDQTGRSRLWDSVTRCHEGRAASIASSGVDAVVILALLKSAATQTVETLLVRQFRPPVGRVTIELPAGLVDAGESPEQAALRELKEETGFIGTVASCSGSVCMSPGVCDETVKLVVVDVDLDSKANQNPSQALEETEFISVTRVPVGSLTAELRRLEAEGAMPIEGLYLLAVGLEMGQGWSR